MLVLAATVALLVGSIFSSSPTAFADDPEPPLDCNQIADENDRNTCICSQATSEKDRNACIWDLFIKPNVDGESPGIRDSDIAEPHEPRQPSPLPVRAGRPPPSPPLGDCFDGALSSEPLHCYVLEQAHGEGVIDIEAIYDTGTSIYVFLRQKEQISDEAREFLRQRVIEYHDRWPGHLPQGPMYDYCVSVRPSYRYCLVDEHSWYASLDIYLPWPIQITAVLVLAGGADYRRNFGGWASWEQLWPAVKSGGPSTGVGPGGFDIPDIDLTPTPAEDIDCMEYPAVGTKFCLWWALNPESGFTGWWFAPYDAEGREVTANVEGDTAKVYLQVKLPPGNPAQLEAIKESLAQDDYDPDIKYEIVVVPVKYDYGKLRRWAKILHRFAYSAGNTIGITAAGVHDNCVAGVVEAVWPLDDVKDACNPSVREHYVSGVREYIAVGANDPERVAAALPILLPQLGIPKDAVAYVWRTADDAHMTGIGVVEPGETINDSISLGGEPTAADDASATDSGSIGLPTWVIAGSVGGVVLAILTTLLIGRRAAGGKTPETPPQQK